jgi:hypothetical protein
MCVCPADPARTCVTVGKRRYDRKQAGYGGQTKPVFHKKVKGGGGLLPQQGKGGGVVERAVAGQGAGGPETKTAGFAGWVGMQMAGRGGGCIVQ